GTAPAAVGDAAADRGVPGHRGHVQVRQALAPGGQVEVAGHGLHLDRPGDSPAQGDVAAHAFDVDLAAVEVEAHVAAHRLHAGLARRADGGAPDAHALDLQ